MRTLSLGIAGAAALAMSSAAGAAITIGSVVDGVNPYAGPAPTYTFDVGSRPAAVGGAFVSGTLGIQHAQPYGTDAGTGAFGGAGGYYSVGPGDGSRRGRPPWCSPPARRRGPARRRAAGAGWWYASTCPPR